MFKFLDRFSIKQIFILFCAVIFTSLVIAFFIETKACGAENDTATTVVTKTTKSSKKTPAPAPKPQKPERVVIGALSPKTTTVVPPAPIDTAVARMRKSGLVESHQVMKLVAFTDTSK